MPNQIKHDMREAGRFARKSLAFLRNIELPAHPTFYHVGYYIFSEPDHVLENRLIQFQGTHDELINEFLKIYEDIIAKNE